eukprot:scaffold57253_cov64-Phaeocystis_antarctica.AAC.5
MRAPTLLRRRPSRRRLPLRRPRHAQRRLLGGGEAAHAHLLATAPHLRLIGPEQAGPLVEVHSEVARLVLGQAQRQPLRLRLLPRLLAPQRHRRCSPPRCRRQPLWRSREAQRRLLGCGEAAQAHSRATAPHPRQVGLELAGLVEAHSKVARLALGHVQRQPLCLRLLPRLLARQRRHRCSPLRRRRLPLRRARDAQRRLLGGGEVAQAHVLAAAPHPRLVGLGLAGLGELYAEEARRVLGH